MRAWQKGILLIGFGLVWGGVFSWYSGDFYEKSEHLLAKTIFLIGALPHVVAVGAWDITDGFGGILRPDWDNTPSKGQVRGLLYVMFAPPISGVLLTYWIDKIYRMWKEK